MEFFGTLSRIDFMKQRGYAMIFSCLIFVVSLGALWTNGLSLGLDFTGGTQVQISTTTPTDLDQVRTELEQAHFKGATVQSYGSSTQSMIRLAPLSEKDQKNIKKTLHKALPNVSIDRVEFIGPQVGKTLMNNGLLALLISIIATMLYIALRFEYRFAVSAAVSLIHDPVLILGVFAAWHIEFNLIALAALLTILGFSLNDTIVVYDRIRENFKKYRKMSTIDIVNLSVNQTLSRTIMTSGLTLLVVLALLLLGGETLFGFSLALAIGIVIGTYSSIYVAGALAVMLGLDRKTLLPRAKPAANTP